MSERGLTQAREALFVGTGLALPLYAFPLLGVAGKSVDLATLLAAAFVAASLPALRRQRRPPFALAFAGAAALVPVLALLPPRPAYFSVGAFATSYVHWLLVCAFFLAALAWKPGVGGLESLLRWNVAAAVLVAAFGLYQSVGIPRHWPATGARLLAIQREDFRFMQLGPHYVRPTSLFLEPSWLGGYLTWCLALTVVVGLSGRSGRRAGWVAAGIVLTSAAVATVSLGTFADLAVLAVASVLVAARAGRLRVRALGAAAGSAVVVVLALWLSPLGRPLWGALRERVRNLGATSEMVRDATTHRQESASFRIQNAELTVEMIASRPLLGIGLGQFVRYLPPERRREDLVEEPWCGWLAIAAQMGVLGPVVLGGALWLVLVVKRKDRSNPARLVAPILVAVAAVQQLHTASFIDLWWWYPVSLAAAFASAETADAADSAVSSF